MANEGPRIGGPFRTRFERSANGNVRFELAGNVTMKQGTTAGRALQKHAARKSSKFVGHGANNARNAQAAEDYIRTILDRGEFRIRDHSKWGEVVDVYAPGTGGARWTILGDFIGLLE